MLLETELTGVPVIVVGLPVEAAAAVRRLRRAGAVVTPVEDAAALATAASQPVATTPQLAFVVGQARTWPGVDRLRSQCLVVTEDAPDPAPRGRITLVGAGPGGAGLLTVDAVRALADADVVLTDRLASVGDLARLAPGAEVIDVGKLPGHHAVPQPEIERIMVDHALQGLTVVRLKGGDPFVFGRGGEEVAAAHAAGLPVTVIPGVTSAVAVPGAAGIPVTHRGTSHTFTVVSGHVPLSDQAATGLAALGGTVVFLMGVHNLVPITAALTRAGLDPATPAAVVERGLTPDMRSVVAPLGTLAAAASAHRVASPAVIVIGEVVRQSEAWAARTAAADPATRTTQPSVGEPAQRHTSSSRRANRGRALTGARR